MSNARNLARLLPNISGLLPTSNLAYTPVNKVGDTMSGNLTLPKVISTGVSSPYSISDATAITVATSTPTVICSTTITTTGKPVLLISSGDCNPAVAGDWHYIQFAIGGTAIGKFIINQCAGASYNNPWAIVTVHQPPAGTWTFQTRAWQGVGSITYGETGSGQAPTIVAVEII